MIIPRNSKSGNFTFHEEEKSKNPKLASGGSRREIKGKKMSPFKRQERNSANSIQ